MSNLRQVCRLVPCCPCKLMARLLLTLRIGWGALKECWCD